MDLQCNTLNWSTKQTQLSYDFDIETTNTGMLQSVITVFNGRTIYLKRLDFMKKLNAIDSKSKSKSTYRFIRDIPDWQRCFQPKTVDFSFRNQVSATPKLAISCKKCGIYLPPEQMSVDHQAPQTRGENLAILRVFRHFGYTFDGPKGNKANPRLKDTSGTTDRRYELTIEGCLFYSCFIHSGYEAELQEMCMHNFYNLDAMCKKCNSSKSNTFKTTKL